MRLVEEWIIKLLLEGSPAAIVLTLGFLWISPKINKLQESVDELDKGKRWTETCDAKHTEVDHRLDRVEKKVFNGSLSA